MLVSGKVSFRGHNGIDHERALTHQQLQELSGWLSTHASGWQLLFVSDPIPSAMCEMTHADGKTREIHLYSQEGWARTVMICDSGHRNCRTQSLSDRDMLTFHQFMGIELGKK